MWISNSGRAALKITPAHDFNDFEIGLKHGLEQIKVIDEAGRMNENAGPYQGMDRFECRKQIVEDFERDGVLIKIEDYHHMVGHCYRCKTIVEPNLSLQWFVKTKPLAKTAIEAVRDGRTRIIPRSGRRPISNGWRIYGIGVSLDRSGGAIVFLPGIVSNAERSLCPRRPRPLAQNAVPIA